MLAHEIAHVELRQAYLRIRDKHVEMELAKEKAEKEKMITDVASMVMGAGLGGRSSRCGWVRCSAAAPAWPPAWKWATTSFIRSLSRSCGAGKEEDDADDMAGNSCWSKGYDPRQIAAPV